MRPAGSQEKRTVRKNSRARYLETGEAHKVGPPISMLSRKGERRRGGGPASLKDVGQEAHWLRERAGQTVPDVRRLGRLRRRRGHRSRIRIEKKGKD